MKNFFSIFAIIFTLIFTLVPVVFAQTGGSTITPPTGGSNIPPPTGGSTIPPANVIKLQNPLNGGANDLYSFIKFVVDKVIIPVGGVVAVLYIMYSGFQLVIAQGDMKKIEQARRGFFWAVIGTVVLLGAWAISTGIQATIEQVTR
jgi:Type IV secretion system pilin